MIMMSHLKKIMDFALAQNNSDLLIDEYKWQKELENQKQASSSKVKHSLVVLIIVDIFVLSLFVLLFALNYHWKGMVSRSELVTEGKWSLEGNGYWSVFCCVDKYVLGFTF